jgi:dolichol kinase
MDECELIVFISSVACAISKCCSTDEITILSVVFTQLGDTLSTILTKRELSDKSTNNDEIMYSNGSINE